MSVGRHTEIERKYDVGSEAAVPPLQVLSDVGSVVCAGTVELDAVYFDTPDLRLARAGVTLRRRTGGDDAGWHLKLPVSEHRREEVTASPTEEPSVPAQLLDRVRGYVRSTPIVAVAAIHTRRTTHRLLDSDGRVLAELADDLVAAEPPWPDAAVVTWREWELELVTGSDALLDEAESALVAAGAVPATKASKLARVLGERLPAVPRPGKRSPDLSTGDLLSAYVAEQRSRLEWQDLRFRCGDGEAVHQLRIAARRLRSALTSYGSVLRPGAADHLLDELKWLGGALARARDAQVMHARLAKLVESQPPELVIGPVAARLDAELGSSYLAGRTEADEALSSERYFRLRDQLDEFADAPPLAERSAVPAQSELPRLLQLEWKRVGKRAGRVERTSDAHQRDLTLHDVRKAAKRLRYTAETAQPVLGKRAGRLAALAKSLQDVLGEHQDTVIARSTLRDVGERAHLSGENGFTFGRLHALEEARAGALELDYRRSLARFPHRKLSRWLR